MSGSMHTFGTFSVHIFSNKWQTMNLEVLDYKEFNVPGVG